METCRKAIRVARDKGRACGRPATRWWHMDTGGRGLLMARCDEHAGGTRQSQLLTEISRSEAEVLTVMMS